MNTFISIASLFLIAFFAVFYAVRIMESIICTCETSILLKAFLKASVYIPFCFALFFSINAFTLFLLAIASIKFCSSLLKEVALLSLDFKMDNIKRGLR